MHFEIYIHPASVFLGMIPGALIMLGVLILVSKRIK